MCRVDDSELYPIGDVARRTGLSVSAIRFYADEGVVEPTGHTDAGYRLYDIEAVARLELVSTLRDLGASLGDIRRLLADGTTLHDLAVAHLAVVEQQLHGLRVRRAVLRTIVKQHSATEQVSLMHKLVTMSDDERDRLIDRFWEEVSDGLDVHPAFVDRLRQKRPVLPEEPTTEQLEAWIELADLVRNEDFRRSFRDVCRAAFDSPRSRESTAPPAMERIEQYLKLRLEARAAQASGVPSDSVQAKEIADRLVAATAAMTGEGDPAEVRRRLAELDPNDERHLEMKAAVAPFTGMMARYHTLVDTINGTRQRSMDPAVAVADREWLARALSPDGQ